MNHKKQILPVEFKTKTGITGFDTDEHPRADMSSNSFGLNDGAAAVVLMERAAMARLAGYSYAAVDLKVHGHRPGSGGALAARQHWVDGR